MDNLKDRTTRLRRTFQYPTDDDDSEDSLPEAMDEQEQERLIERLAAANASRDAQTQLILLALPALAALPYIPLLLRPATTLFALLGFTSFCSTGFLLYRLPPTVTGVDVLDSWVKGNRNGTQTRRDKLRLGLVSGQSRSPLETYLPYLNLGLVALLALMGALAGVGRGSSFGWIGVGNLPALVYAVVIVAKMAMGGVDPEKELSALKYEYKGA